MDAAKQLEKDEMGKLTPKKSKGTVNLFSQKQLLSLHLQFFSTLDLGVSED